MVFPETGLPAGAELRLYVDRVKAEAAGRWLDILPRVGIPPKLLTKKNKPCPACGGTDRFSFIDAGRGAFVCRAHDRQGGDGFELVRHYLGCDFIGAVKAVSEALGLSPASGSGPLVPPARPAIADTPKPATFDRGGLLETWQSATGVGPLSPAGLYLKARGLHLPNSDALRAVRMLPYWHDRRLIGRHPAMLALLSGPDGGFVGLHRTYVSPAGHKATLHDDAGQPLTCKKLATIREGVMRGSAVRLFAPQAGRLALAEGIETALAVREASGLPVWACVSAFGLETVALPDDVRDVFVFADNDRSGTGQRAADRLARRLRSEGRAVRVNVPNTPDSDWLDVLNAGREQTA